MIYIDGERLPQPLRHRYRGLLRDVWCPTQEYCAPDHGLPIPGGKNWSGKVTWYRYHIADPVYFEKSITSLSSTVTPTIVATTIAAPPTGIRAEPHTPFKASRPWRRGYRGSRAKQGLDRGGTDGTAASKFKYLEISPRMFGLFRGLVEEVISREFLNNTC